MPRRTNIDILVDTLQEFDNAQASRKRLASELGWDLDKIDRVVEQAKSDSTRPIQIGSGGVVKYRGSERGKEVGIYNDVRRVIENYWGKKNGLRDARVANSAHTGRRNEGVWTHPDLVMQALPRRRKHRDDPPDLHSIEVETYSGFDIKSVYQAHAQGRGADFSWVFFATAPTVNPPHERIMWAAEELGIGMVQFDRAGASSTYELLSDAERKTPTPEERKRFCETVGVAEKGWL